MVAKQSGRDTYRYLKYSRNSLRYFLKKYMYLRQITKFSTLPKVQLYMYFFRTRKFLVQLYGLMSPSH